MKTRYFSEKPCKEAALWNYEKRIRIRKTLFCNYPNQRIRSESPNPVLTANLVWSESESTRIPNPVFAKPNPNLRIRFQVANPNLRIRFQVANPNPRIWPESGMSYETRDPVFRLVYNKAKQVVQTQRTKLTEPESWSLSLNSQMNCNTFSTVWSVSCETAHQRLSFSIQVTKLTQQWINRFE